MKPIISNDFIDLMKRMVLETESLIDCIERDPDSNLMWMGDEKALLELSIKEVKKILW